MLRRNARHASMVCMQCGVTSQAYVLIWCACRGGSKQPVLLSILLHSALPVVTRSLLPRSYALSALSFTHHTRLLQEAATVLNLSVMRCRQ
jgi:hypothetical protein